MELKYKDVINKDFKLFLMMTSLYSIQFKTSNNLLTAAAYNGMVIWNEEYRTAVRPSKTCYQF